MSRMNSIENIALDEKEGRKKRMYALTKFFSLIDIKSFSWTREE